MQMILKFDTDVDENMCHMMILTEQNPTTRMNPKVKNPDYERNDSESMYDVQDHGANENGGAAFCTRRKKRNINEE